MKRLYEKVMNYYSVNRKAIEVVVVRNDTYNSFNQEINTTA
jgi:hypothetical protein